MGVFCFVKHGSYPKYAWSRPASELKAEGTAMDVVKNILLFLSNTPNKSPSRYASAGSRGGAAKDTGHRNLCALRTQEMLTGQAVTFEDLSQDMQDYILHGGFTPIAEVGEDLRASKAKNRSNATWLSNVLANIQRTIQAKR